MRPMEPETLGVYRMQNAQSILVLGFFKERPWDGFKCQQYISRMSQEALRDK